MFFAQTTLALLLTLIGAVSFAASTDKAAKKFAPLNFNGVEYFHRWSEKDSHEYTPAGQEDLQKWTDMVTVNRYSDVRNSANLAAVAEAVLANYKKHRAIEVTAATVPSTATQPAEHIIVVIFGRSEFIEAAFARFKLVDGVGVSVVYSHRIYGKPVGDQMSVWMEKNGAMLEEKLMSWDKVPVPAATTK